MVANMETAAKPGFWANVVDQHPVMSLVVRGFANDDAGPVTKEAAN